MAVFKNTTSEIGDVLQITADSPVIGLIALSSFVDVTQGETVSKFFTKQFRYSVDGINYSPWQELTNDNLALVEVQSNDTFFAQYLYQRSGADSSGTIAFNSVTLNGSFVDIADGPAYKNSNFSQFFVKNNVCSIAWSINVLEKLYKKGILPNFIERDFSGNNADDRDFIDLWRAVTHYWALYVCLARQFQTFYTNQTLLLQYLVEKGLLVCSDEELTDLLYLMTNYYDEIRQRGTRQVFLPKDEELADSVKQIDGEYLRLLCYVVGDEFLYNLNKNQHIGWNIGNSSPLYKGLEDRLNVNKYYCDFIDDILSVSELSIATSSLPYVSIVMDHDLEDESISVSESGSISDSDDSYAKVIKIAPPTLGDARGLGNGSKKIVINPNLDYEITFLIKRDGSLIDPAPTFTFGINCFDAVNNISQPLNISTLLASNDFLTQVVLNKSEQYYFVRGILFNRTNYKIFDPLTIYKVNNIVKLSGIYYRCLVETVAGEDPVSVSSSWQVITATEIAASLITNLGEGNNLISTGCINYIDPYILYDNVNNSTANLYVYNIRVQPLSTPYSKGFINTTNFLELWSTNNNQQYSQDYINATLRKYLIPANTVFENIFTLSSECADEPDPIEEAIKLFEDEESFEFEDGIGYEFET